MLRTFSQWTRVNLNSNGLTLVPASVIAASTGRRPTLSHAGSVSTLLARPDFLQYPAYHRPILPTPLGQFSVFSIVYLDRLYFLIYFDPKRFMVGQSLKVSISKTFENYSSKQEKSANYYNFNMQEKQKYYDYY